MPGSVIGTTFEPLPELVWKGCVEISRFGNEIRVKFAYEEPSGSPVAEKVHRAIDAIKKELQKID